MGSFDVNGADTTPAPPSHHMHGLDTTPAASQGAVGALVVYLLHRRVSGCCVTASSFQDICLCTPNRGATRACERRSRSQFRSIQPVTKQPTKNSKKKKKEKGHCPGIFFHKRQTADRPKLRAVPRYPSAVCTPVLQCSSARLPKTPVQCCVVFGHDS